VLDELARQCRELFLRLTDAEVVPWDELGADAKNVWLESSERIAEFVAQEIPTTFGSLGRRHAAIHYSADKWSELSDPEKLAHEICARHITNLVFAEDQVDLKSIQEFDWMAWKKKTPEA